MSPEEYLERRKNGAIAVLLRHKEKHLDEHLSAHESDALRQLVLDQFNEYHRSVIDIVAKLDDGTVVLNELYLDMIADIHSQVVGSNGQVEGQVEADDERLPDR